MSFDHYTKFCKSHNIMQRQEVQGVRLKQTQQPLPGWYNEGKVEDAIEKLDEMEQSLSRAKKYGGEVARVALENYKAHERYVHALGQKPNIFADGRATDEAVQIYRELSDEIAAGLPTRDDDKFGSANVNIRQRLRWESGFWYPVGNKHDLFTELGVNIIEGKCTGKSLIIVWKITGRLLNKPTNTDVLVRTRNTNTFVLHRDIYAMERDEGIR